MIWLNGWYDNILGGYVLAIRAMDIGMGGGGESSRPFMSPINLLASRSIW